MAGGKVGAPTGNKNAGKGKPWLAALERVGMQDPEKLRAIAIKVYEMAMAGDMQAIKEIGDRLDGKPVQQVDSNVSLSGLVAEELSTRALLAIAAGAPPEEAAGLH